MNKQNFERITSNRQFDVEEAQIRRKAKRKGEDLKRIREESRNAKHNGGHYE